MPIIGQLGLDFQGKENDFLIFLFDFVTISIDLYSKKMVKEATLKKSSIFFRLQCITNLLAYHLM